MESYRFKDLHVKVDVARIARENKEMNSKAFIVHGAGENCLLAIREDIAKLFDLMRVTFHSGDMGTHTVGVALSQFGSYAEYMPHIRRFNTWRGALGMRGSEVTASGKCSGYVFYAFFKRDLESVKRSVDKLILDHAAMHTVMKVDYWR